MTNLSPTTPLDPPPEGLSSPRIPRTVPLEWLIIFGPQQLCQLSSGSEPKTFLLTIQGVLEE